jgi:hypothetical protein
LESLKGNLCMVHLAAYKHDLHREKHRPDRYSSGTGRRESSHHPLNEADKDDYLKSVGNSG